MNKPVFAALIILSAVPAVQAQLFVPSTDSTACGKITAVTTAYFDTIATWVEGRIINSETKRPISKAAIHVAYYDCYTIVLKTQEVLSDDSGFFRLGWVGCHSARLLAVEAAGYCTMRTGKVDMGGESKVTVELMPVVVKDERHRSPKSKK
ncbi:hypothetical protein GCM10027422_30320 [Hymenobacter arcticus]